MKKKAPPKRRKQASQGELATEQSKQEGKPASKSDGGWVAHTYSTPNKDIHVVMPKDIAKHHGNPTDPAQKSYSLIRERIQGDFRWLLRMAAKGEWDAIQMLAEFGIDAGATLESLSALRPEEVKRVARTFSEWPMVISPESDYPHNPKKLRRLIELGKGVVAPNDKVLHKKKPLLQRVVMFNTLRLFLNLRQVISSTQRADQLKKILSDVSEAKDVEQKTNAGNAAAHSIHRTLLIGELQKSERKADGSRAAVKYHKRQLRTALTLPIPSPDVANTATSKALLDGSRLPQLSLATRDQWFELMITFLIALTENELEENEVLRKLGDSRGDVEIRNFCKDTDPEVFKRWKLELRHDATVNGAIGRRIKEKLRDAFDVLVSERV